MMELKELILKLSSVPGPSGFEDAVRETARELLVPFADEVKTDAMGNLTAFLKGTEEGAPTLLLSAHMDEVGLIVTGYEERGFLRFDALGGVDPRMLPAQEVLILSEPPLTGFVAVMPPHVLSGADMEKAIPLDGLFIDTGLDDETLRKRVPPGTPAVIASPARELGTDFVSGRGLDDRACAAILLKVMEALSRERPRVNTALLLTVQEEVGRRGAKTGAYGVRPDAAVAVDVTFGRAPDSKPEKTFPLGSGAAIGVGPGLNRSMTRRLFEIAGNLGIPHETEVLPGDTGTDGWVIEQTRAGVPTALVSLPLKYMHSPVEVVSVRDAGAIAELLTEYVRSAEAGRL